jgi:hypothetical protein
MKTAPSFRDLERIHGVTWHELTELEPRLGELLWDARQACVTCRAWSDVDRAFASIRNALADLVGFASKNYRHPVLGRRGAYQVAYWKLYGAVAGLLPGRPAGAGEALEESEGAVAEIGTAEPATANPGRRFGRTLGFWLGAIALGTAGCLLGASMPYRHPVARTISVLWWGIFLGCFGSSLGALLGLWAEQPPASPFQGSGAAGKSPSGANSPALPPGTSSILSGANRGSDNVRARSVLSDGSHGRVEA